MIFETKDTIAAIATPIGVGGISVIRISGNSTFQVVDSIFRGSVSINEARSHTIHYGTVSDSVSRETIDTVLVSIFRNPHSYTGEDIVEISSHGGYFVSQKILSSLYSSGVRPAEPGEFTLRAFLNGKLDLSQAEAVADLINSKTEKSHRASVEQLGGKLSKTIQKLRGDILNICSLLELELDFSQEGIELIEKNKTISQLAHIENSIKNLMKSYQEGKIIKEGIKVALIGKPNAGKSSLLNVLLQEERAIVSEIPGTTRDTIEETIILDGVEFIFNDTAGLRNSIDSIEIEGIKRTSKVIDKSDLVLFIIDGSQQIEEEDFNSYNKLIDKFKSSKQFIWVFNKSDIKNKGENLIGTENPVWVSCKTHAGIVELKNRIVNIALPKHDSAASSVTITSIRHKDALEKALNSIVVAKLSINSGLSVDFAAVDLRAALNYLGEIIGLTTPDDILNNIFSNFCIGK